MVAHQVNGSVAEPVALVRYEQQTRNVTAFEPEDTEAAFRLAQRLHAGKLLSKSITSPEAAFTIILAGREIGLTVMQSLRLIHVIDGKISYSADLQMALCLKQPELCEYFKCLETTDKIARFETKRVGKDPQELSFTIAEAEQAQLVNKDNWRKYPKAMLRARCIAALARLVYPELMAGMYDPDELERDDAAPQQQAQVKALRREIAKAEAKQTLRDEAKNDTPPPPADDAIDAEYSEPATEQTIDQQIAHWSKLQDEAWAAPAGELAKARGAFALALQKAEVPKEVTEAITKRATELANAKHKRKTPAAKMQGEGGAE